MKVELNGTDKLIFPRELIFREKSNNNLLIISPKTANWIVIKKNYRKFLDDFISGKSIGEVFNSCKNIFEKEKVQLVLKAILAQKFAGINEEIKGIDLHTFSTLRILLTNKCNLRCKHCYMFSGKGLTNELSKDDWISIIKEFKDLGGKEVSFSGGEVLTYDGFADLVKYSYKLGLDVEILSNGILWDDDIINELSPYIKGVQISLDGYDEETNSKIRGAGHFDKALNTILKLSNKGVPVNIATTLDPSILNEKTKYEYKKLVDSIKAIRKNVSFSLTKRLIKGREIDISNSENEEYERKTKEIANYSNSKEDAYIISGTIRNGVVRNCGIGGLVINSVGNIFGCSRLDSSCFIGNIKTNSLEYFLQKGKDLCNSTSVETMDTCKNCHLRYICGGGCKLDQCTIVDGKFIHKPCSEKTKETIEDKLLNSFLNYYDFTEELTLDEAIEHCIERSKNLEDDTCAVEHLHLANWLSELKTYKTKYGNI